MPNFCIETYLNNLPETTVSINVNNKQLNYLPDLTRFTHLEKLYCANNQLTSLPRLNEKLQRLDCANNQLTFLPRLNENLQTLYCHDNQLVDLPTLNAKLCSFICSYNQLTSLPRLNENLQELCCNHNQLTSLPRLNKKLNTFWYDNNPIYEIINSDKIFLINTKLKILHNFCHLYYCLKFKRQFRDFLWKKIREPKIIQKYHPSYLLNFLTDENADIDVVLENWL
jgi:Leucine-rich repeat (LRR) protein